MLDSDSKNDFKNEWDLLQNQFDSYEKYSLVIKLVNISILTAGYISNNVSFFLALLLVAVWMQDAIWKTFQSRIESRLLHIEDCLLDDNDSDDNIEDSNVEDNNIEYNNVADKKAYQFNSEYKNNRQGTAELIREYLEQALRPTIAYPHVVLLILCFFCMVF